MNDDGAVIVLQNCWNLGSSWIKHWLFTLFAFAMVAHGIKEKPHNYLIEQNMIFT